MLPFCGDAALAPKGAYDDGAMGGVSCCLFSFKVSVYDDDDALFVGGVDVGVNGLTLSGVYIKLLDVAEAFGLLPNGEYEFLTADEPLPPPPPIVSK